MPKEKIVVSWSGGKDSAYGLYEILRSGKYEVLALLTAVTEDERIKMHGVRQSLLELQAASIGLPLVLFKMSQPSKNGEYESKMQEALEVFRAQGATSIVFGDLFLEDIKSYRDQCLEKWRFKGIYPLWKRPTPELAREMIASGFRSVLACVDTRALDSKFAGREFDDALLAQLPEKADPCAENGEFHTFVYDGPIFKKPVAFTRDGYFLKDGRFYYCDLKPVEALCGKI